MLAATADFGGTDRFSIVRRLGAGGMGVVYQAWDREREAQVALKTLRNLDANNLLRFKREFRALADLSHPNLVRLGELHCRRGQWFFTMDLVEGVDFLSWVRPSASVACDDDDDLAGEADTVERRFDGDDAGCDLARLRASLQQLACGVAALHDANMVHRDIKPSNVLVTPDGRTVLLDFGLAASLESLARPASEVNVVGTAAYMAPEQGAAEAIGPPADWYSVGAMIYEALLGRPPFVGTPLSMLVEKQRREPAAPRAIDPTVPEDLDALCVELLRRDPRRRASRARVMVALGLCDRSDPAPHATSSSGPLFVGRKAELAALDEALADSRGRTVSLFVHGESGLGKSTLVRHFTRGLLSRDPDAVVLAGRCYERESVPFKAFDDIVDELTSYLYKQGKAAAALLPRDVGVLARVFPVLRRIPAVSRAADARSSPMNLLELRTRAFAQLREILRRIALRHPLVVVIDDLQWADADSLALLEELLHPDEAPAMLLVATVRTDGAQRVSGRIGEVRHRFLERLGHAEAETLAIELGRDAGDAAAIARDAGGNPLFIHELVRHAAQVGTRGTLDEALWARIERLEPPARRLLEVVAVAGAPIAQGVAEAAAEVANVTAVLRVQRLVRTTGTGARDRIEPYHDRVRETVLAHLDDETRRHHHAHLADALVAAGAAVDDLQSLVRHLQAAGESQRAALQAERAAALAAETLAFDQAAELYRMALHLGQHSGEETRALRIKLGDALTNAGRGPEAADELLAAATGNADTATRLECQRRAAEQLLGSGHIARGLTVLDAVLGEVDESLPKTPARALASLLWQRAKLRLRGLGWRERDESRIAPRDLTKLDIYKGVAILGQVDATRGADFQARGLLLALKTGEPRRVARALAFEAIFVATQGRGGAARARALLDESTRLAKRSGDPYLNALACGAAGIVEMYAGGRFRVAAERLGEAERRLRDETTGTALELSSCRLFRLLALRYMGAYAELRRWGTEYVRDAARRGDRFAETTMTRAFNVVWLSVDEPARARRELERRGWEPPESGYHVQHWYELFASSELALYEASEDEHAPALAEGFATLFGTQLVRVQMIRAAANWTRARLSLGRAERSGDPRLVDEAERLARALEGEKMGYIDVWAAFVRAAVAVQRGRRDDACAQLQRAAALSDAEERRGYAAAARRRWSELATGDEAVELRRRADRFAADEGIKDAARMTRLIAPGFTTDRQSSMEGRAIAGRV